MHPRPECACPSRRNRNIPRLLVLTAWLTGCGGGGGGQNDPPVDDPDTEAPTVAITAPAPGSVLGIVAVTATAADNEAVTSVQFRLDGGTLGAADTEAPWSYHWNSATSTNGAHTLTAVARDAAGNEATSVGVTVQVNNPTTGTLSAAATTTGDDLDADGYFIDAGNGPQAVASNGSTLSWEFPAGARNVTLTGVAENCTVVGYSRVQAPVTLGATTQVGFNVRCSSLTLPAERIAWRANVADTDGPKLYTMRGDGTDRQLLVNDEWARDVEWTQDRTKLYYGSIAMMSSLAVFSIDANGSNAHRIQVNTGWQIDPTSSPDGQKIAFEVEQFPEGIWVANANGSSPVRLGDGEKPAWAPSADSILFQSGNAVWIMAANGANAHQLIANAAWPHWSPNGSRILFLRAPGPADIFPPAWWAANADGSGEVKVVELTMLENWGASWSPNGRKIVYYDAPAGENDLWTINIDGTGATNLTNSTEEQPEQHESPSWFR